MLGIDCRKNLLVITTCPCWIIQTNSSCQRINWASYLPLVDWACCLMSNHLEGRQQETISWWTMCDILSAISWWACLDGVSVSTGDRDRHYRTCVILSVCECWSHCKSDCLYNSCRIEVVSRIRLASCRDNLGSSRPCVTRCIPYSVCSLCTPSPIWWRLLHSVNTTCGVSDIFCDRRDKRTMIGDWKRSRETANVKRVTTKEGDRVWWCSWWTHSDIECNCLMKVLGARSYLVDITSSVNNIL